LIFYAGINLGFGSGYKSQVNEVLLQTACFDLLTELHSIDLRNQFNSEIIKPNSEQKTAEDLLIIDSPFSPDSPFVAIDDSILANPDSSDLGKILDSSNVIGSLKGKDSLKTKVKVNQDSLRLFQMSLDSSARLEYFRYQREDVPYTTLSHKKKSKFFIEPSPSYKTRKLQLIRPESLLRLKNNCR
jgi:hypothetical protein